MATLKQRPSCVCRSCGERAEFELFDDRHFLRGFYCEDCGRLEKTRLDELKKEERP